MWGTLQETNFARGCVKNVYVKVVGSRNIYSNPHSQKSNININLSNDKQKERQDHLHVIG